MTKQDDFSKTVRLEIPPEFLKEDIKRKQSGITERILPSSKLGTKTKELFQIKEKMAHLGQIADERSNLIHEKLFSYKFLLSH